MQQSTALTFYDDMALVRALDIMVPDLVGQSYERARDVLLRAVANLDRERNPRGVATCPMCGSALVPAQAADSDDGTTAHHEPRRDGPGLGKAGLGAVVGATGGAVIGALAAEYLERRAKTKAATLSDKLIALLRAQPGRPIGDLAKELYDEDTQNNRSKVRALLAQLGRAGKLRNISPGHWEVVDDEEGG